MKTNDTLLTVGIIGAGAFILWNLNKGFQGIGQGVGTAVTDVGSSIGSLSKEITNVGSTTSQELSKTLKTTSTAINPTVQNIGGIAQQSTGLINDIVTDFRNSINYALKPTEANRLKLLGFNENIEIPREANANALGIDYARQLYAGGNPQIYAGTTSKSIKEVQTVSVPASSIKISGAATSQVNLTSSKAIAAKYAAAKTLK